MLWLPQCNKVQFNLLVSLATLPGFNPIWFGTQSTCFFTLQQAAGTDRAEQSPGHPAWWAHTPSCAHFLAHALKMTFSHLQHFWLFVKISPESLQELKHKGRCYGSEVPWCGSLELVASSPCGSPQSNTRSSLLEGDVEDSPSPKARCPTPASSSPFPNTTPALGAAGAALLPTKQPPQAALASTALSPRPAFTGTKILKGTALQ